MITVDDLWQTGFHKRTDFMTTQWSVVLEAAEASPESRTALESLCRAYWYPLFAYSRRRGASIDEAQDAVQQFFAQLLERDTLTVADPNRGRFRSFLLTAFRNSLTNDHKKRNARKRCAEAFPVRIDGRDADAKLAHEPFHDVTPERLYRQLWAITLLNHVMSRLREEYTRRGQEKQFDCLKKLLAGRSTETSYDEVGRELDISAAATMTAVSRMRRRYRELLRLEISRTVSGADEVEDEIHELFDSLSL